MTEPRYPLVVVDVTEGEAEEAGARLFELGALGVEQRDDTTLIKGALHGARVTLVASFGTPEEAHEAIAALPTDWRAVAGEVIGDAWRDEWKKHFEPFVLCRSRARAIVVRPPWREHDARDDESVIVLEPGRAFGTGLHETTRLVAEILADESPRLAGAAVLDVGCGSGVLSLVALALGAAAARAVDVDVDAVAVTRENAERNGWGDRVHADDARAEAVTAQYPVVVANIEASPLVALATALRERVAPGGILVLSGILTPEASPGQWDGVQRAYAGFTVRELRQRGEWLAAVLVR